jgi:hypothetical protein
MDLKPLNEDLQSNEQIDNMLFLILAVIPHSIAAMSADAFDLKPAAPNVVANSRATCNSRLTAIHFPSVLTEPEKDKEVATSFSSDLTTHFTLKRLKRFKFLKLMETNTTWTRKEENDEDGDDNKSIIEQMKETRRERSKSNQVLMNSRNDDGGDGGRGGDGDNELVDKNEKIEEEEKEDTYVVHDPSTTENMLPKSI